MTETLKNGDPDAFSGFHPAILFIYFLGVLFFGMFSMHPVILLVTFVSEFIYSVMLNGKRALKFNVLNMLPITFAVALINPLINHGGVTILLYINDNPVTLESILCGMIYALAFITVIISFSCFNKIMTSDKLMYLFGRLVPTLSLMFSMTLRFVPRYKAQIKKITDAQKCIGMDPSHGNIIRRVKNGVRIISVLITWALENAIETSDSMKARGFGLKGRTSFSIFHWKKRDKLMLAAELILIGIPAAGLASGRFESIYFPAVCISGLDLKTVFFYFAYAVFCLLPATEDIKEFIIWNRLKSAD